MKKRYLLFVVSLLFLAGSCDNCNDNELNLSLQIHNKTATNYNIYIDDVFVGVLEAGEVLLQDELSKPDIVIMYQTTDEYYKATESVSLKPGIVTDFIIDQTFFPASHIRINDIILNSISFDDKREVYKNVILTIYNCDPDNGYYTKEDNFLMDMLVPEIKRSDLPFGDFLALMTYTAEASYDQEYYFVLEDDEKNRLGFWPFVLKNYIHNSPSLYSTIYLTDPDNNLNQLLLKVDWIK